MNFRRHRAPIIAIAHKHLASDDSIGRDVLGVQRTLAEAGVEVILLAESFDENLPERLTTSDIGTARKVDADLLIYHHSAHWEVGERLLRRFAGRVVFRYHGVIPPSFFEPYSSKLGSLSRAAIVQTKRLIHSFKSSSWLAYSELSRQELVNSGVRSDQVLVVPPFNRSAELLSPLTVNSSGVRVMFAGRFSPHNAHEDLLRVVQAYLQHVGSDIELDIIGPMDLANLGGYVEEIQEMIGVLGLCDHVRIAPWLHFNQLRQEFGKASVFLSCSRYRRSGLTMIEAQAAGLPVGATGAGAAEVLGPGQVVSAAPSSLEDYRFLALVVRELAVNSEFRSKVIRSGYRNAIARFSDEAIGNALLTCLLPILERSS